MELISYQMSNQWMVRQIDGLLKAFTCVFKVSAWSSIPLLSSHMHILLFLLWGLL